MSGFLRTIFFDNTSPFQWLRPSNPQKDIEKAGIKRANIQENAVFSTPFLAPEKGLRRFFFYINS